MADNRPLRLEELPDVLTPEDVARVLRCSRKTVYDYCRKGIIPHRKLGSFVRISRREFLAWLNGASGEEAQSA